MMGLLQMLLLCTWIVMESMGNSEEDLDEVICLCRKGGFP